MATATHDPLQLTAEAARALAPKELEAALEAWVKAKRPELAAALAASADKAVARAAKKALYQLKSLGVDLPAAEAPKAPARSAPAPAKEDDELSSGLLSHVLGTGERALFFARPRTGGGLDIFQCILHDELGIQQLGKAESNRGAFRRRVREVRAKKEPVLVVDLARVRRELGRALALNAESHSPLPEGADSHLRRLEVTPIEAPEPMAAPEAADEGLSQRGPQLFDQPEIAQWLPPEASIKTLAQRVDEVNASPLELSPAQRKEQLQHKVELVAEALLTERVRALYARRLAVMAEVFDATDRPDAAKVARASGRLLGRPGTRSPFIERMLSRVIELSAKQRAEEAAATQG